ncbi:haloalkane dehalogenase [Pseudoalteromonas sp. MMG013]|uniref:haloalkane dehalogenase n=1 Tax=Pseudoalteromonas sp. MMG013 TaxID=2822687 RepID=UPI001B37D623|nr:haloalkane dehalogenase [Pseudoalteromonas sp. MMG013]MBQ4862166.1 haloalkane dehalogenase [Pseudoalteromonas sp. MMG013]
MINYTTTKKTVVNAIQTLILFAVILFTFSISAHANNTWQAQKKFVDVFGKKMAYIERGEGRPIVFIHGNPTSSYLWRNVIPHVAGQGRIIVVDQMGMGDSDKLPAEETDRYRLVSYTKYFAEFMRKINAKTEVTLVLHDWGGAVGFDWAFHNQASVRGIAYMETFIKPLEWKDLPKDFHPTLKAVRAETGLKLVLEENMFIEKMLPSVTTRALTQAQMDEYRRPYLHSGDDRLPTLQWPREVPIAGQPADVATRIGNYSNWLTTSKVPKLFIDAEPGVFITGDVRKFAKSLPNQTIATAKGLHFMQEDDPDTIGKAISQFLISLP